MPRMLPGRIACPRAGSWFAAWMALFASSPAWAHRPWFAPDGHARIQDALPVPDVSLSTVTYRTVTCGAPQLWMSFEADPSKELYFQVGVPKLPWLAGYRPSVAVLARGFPSVDGQLPFAIPAGLGARVFPSGHLEGKAYHEFVTQTDSWILQTETLAMPESGPGYLVVWDPEARTGKFWLAVGRKEDFGARDWLMLMPWVRQARIFHGAFPHALKPAPPVGCGQAPGAS